MRLKKCLTVSRAVVLALTLLIPPLSTTAQTRPSPAASGPAYCAWESNGEYSRGAALLVAGTRYVCANVRNRDWQPAGVTWVRVDLVGSDFVLSRPSTAGFCERSSNGEYSPGAVLNVSGEVARCATVFDARFNPSGVAWIDVRSLGGDDFAPRIH